MDRRIDQLFDKALKELARYGIFLDKPLGDQPFSFADYPEVQQVIDSIFEEFRQSVEVTITEGLAWEDNLSASKATDIASRYGVAVAQQRSQAVAGFAQRKVGGLDLSQRVWNITDTFEKEVETAMDIALRDGTPANRLATDLKQYLKHPDKLFRRVRDEHGQLQLSKRAKEFHPGAGVYRSSYKNARRLAVTETNMAYHKADNERWRQLDFVLGYEVQVSGTNPNVCPICIELAGKYPKEFEFVGWHPHCRCHAVPIMEDIDSFQARQDALLRGERIPATGQVTEPPKNFTDHLKDNSDRLQRASKAGTLPYFVRDNYKVGKDGTLTPTFNVPKKPSKPAPPSILERAKARHEARTPEEVKDIKRRLIQRNADIRHANRTPEEIQFIKDSWSERRASRQTTQGYPSEWRAKNLANAQKRHEARTKKQVADTQDRLLLRSVRNKVYDADKALPSDAKWFRNKEVIISQEGGKPVIVERRSIVLEIETQNNCNGSTNLRGTIRLTRERCELCQSAIKKINANQIDKITKGEADAMATLWHEITHNRHLITEVGGRTPTQTKAMEMMNEFVARKTLPEFYSKLGASKTPWTEFMTNRDSTGYNRMVNDFDYLIDRFKLDKDKVLQTAKAGLFDGDYTKQEENAVDALLDGGLKDFKRLDGKKITKTQVGQLVAMCRDKWDVRTIEYWLKENAILEPLTH